MRIYLPIILISTLLFSNISFSNSHQKKEEKKEERPQKGKDIHSFIRDEIDKISQDVFENYMGKIDHEEKTKDTNEDLNLSTPFFKLMEDREALNSGDQDFMLAKFLSDYHIIYSGGILSELALLGKVVGLKGVVNFERQEDFFKELNKKFKKEDVSIINHRNKSDTFNSVEYNRIKLEELVTKISKDMKGKKGIILVGHSKGGIEILDFLIKNQNLRPFIKGVITFQSPFYGSPIADMFTDYVLSRLVTSWFLGLKTGTKIFQKGISSNLKAWFTILKKRGSLNEGLSDLEVELRNDYMHDVNNAAEIAKITEGISIINYMSYVEQDEKFILTETKPPFNLISRVLSIFDFLQGDEKNDYFVPYRSQYIDGAHYVATTGDHISGVCWTQSMRKKEQVETSKALFHLLRELIDTNKSH